MDAENNAVSQCSKKEQVQKKGVQKIAPITPTDETAQEKKVQQEVSNTQICNEQP